jgi:hypothetical protein
MDNSAFHRETPVKKLARVRDAAVVPLRCFRAIEVGTRSLRAYLYRLSLVSQAMTQQKSGHR